MMMPSFKTVELCLTYRCNVQCDNCSNLCTQAPAQGDLTPGDVQAFLKDSKDAGHVWGMITLHGGEPVLNPWIYDIARLLAEYRSETGCKLWLLTNNSTNKVREIVTRISLRHDIPLGVSAKRVKNIDEHGSPIPYVPVNESPEDLNEPWTVGCFQARDCGVCFNYLGYFPCSPIAAAARVFGYAPIKSISDLTEETCTRYFNKQCRHCGFAMPNRRRVVEQVSTQTWAKAFEAYHKEKDQRR